MKLPTILSFLLAAATAASATKRPCSQAEVALATGIHLNIQGQYAEYNGTLKVIEVETTRPGDLLAFENAKGQLQSDIQAGMNLRLFNQQIAPKDNPAVAGLAKYEAAQETEKSQVDGLCGIYIKDKAVLEKLKGEVTDGIKLNEMNLANVSLFRDLFVTLLYWWFRGLIFKVSRLLPSAISRLNSRRRMRWVHESAIV